MVKRGGGGCWGVTLGAKLEGLPGQGGGGAAVAPLGSDHPTGRAAPHPTPLPPGSCSTNCSPAAAGRRTGRRAAPEPGRQLTIGCRHRDKEPIGRTMAQLCPLAPHARACCDGKGGGGEYRSNLPIARALAAGRKLGADDPRRRKGGQGREDDTRRERKGGAMEEPAARMGHPPPPPRLMFCDEGRRH